MSPASLADTSLGLTAGSLPRRQIKKQEAAANAKRIKAEEAARLKAQMELFKPQQAQKVPFGVGTCRRRGARMVASSALTA
jgi:hypothetical protein